MTLPDGVRALQDGDAAAADRVILIARFGELLLDLEPVAIGWASAAVLGANTRAATRQLPDGVVVLVRDDLAADPWLVRTILHELRHVLQFERLQLDGLSAELRALLERDAQRWASRWAGFYAQLEQRWAELSEIAAHGE